MLLDRLSALGGRVEHACGGDEAGAQRAQILDAAIDLEERAVAHYRALRSRITRKSMLLWETVEEIIEDEEAELERLRRLRGRRQAASARSIP
jgi:hypothetical protein